ncbi:MAG: YdiU family protein [Deltaproteobacteria bacterium]|nr:YdiU family protein [Deltaproteobacteria bacterium]MCB9786151.1 YdiU family protein [Deltaproteobacteria bacterium]
MPVSATYQPARDHESLGPALFDPVQPARFPRHVLRFRNQRHAERVGLGALTPAEWEAHFARFEPLPGSLQQPLALRYHGYQFRSYNPNLGDGRGFLHAQLRDPVDGRLLDLATKGSGQTPWSRGGDGRLTLKGGVREILATELLEARGVNTSKTFSLFETGEQLIRGDEPSPTRSSVLVRLGHSHIRFGTFERLAWQRDAESAQRLVRFCLERYYPEVPPDERPEAARLLANVALRSADLAASWMAAGFVHGVLNTDNMNIAGESFDYGPWRFLPTFDLGFTAAYFDHSGLYAFGRQPDAVLWNLERLAEALAPLAPEAELAQAIDGYAPAFEAALHRRVLGRLGLRPRGGDEDGLLVRALFTWMHEQQADYDQAFHDWYGGAASAGRAARSPQRELHRGDAFERFRRWLDTYEATHPERLSHTLMQRERPESLLIDEVEALWEPIAAADDWAPLEAKVAAIREAGALMGQGPGA